MAGTNRGLRGGSFVFEEEFMHAAFRHRMPPMHEDNMTGFRVTELP